MIGIIGIVLFSVTLFSNSVLLGKLSDAQSEINFLREAGVVSNKVKEVEKKEIKKSTAYSPSKDMDRILKNDNNDLFS